MVLVVATTILIGFPQWLETLLVARPLAEDADVAGVPYGIVVSLSLVFSIAAALSFVAAAALIGWRKRRSAFATFVVLALLLRAPGFVTEITRLADRTPEWAGATLTVRALDAVCALLFLYVFPTGTFLPRQTAILWSVWAAWVIGTLATPAFNPALNLDEWWAEITVATLALTGLAAQIYRYREASNAHQRLQTKWIVYGIAAYVLVFAAQQLVPVLAPVVRGPGAARLWYRVIFDTANNAAAMLVPITIGIAILRAKLLGIDLIINRTIVYVAVTMFLAAVFTGVSNAVQTVLGNLTGHGSDTVSVVLAMAVAAAFAPLKSYVQRIVDRRMAYRRLVSADPPTNVRRST